MTPKGAKRRYAFSSAFLTIYRGYGQSKELKIGFWDNILVNSPGRNVRGHFAGRPEVSPMDIPLQ